MNTPELLLQVPDARLRQVCAPVEEAVFGSESLPFWD